MKTIIDRLLWFFLVLFAVALPLSISGMEAALGIVILLWLIGFVMGWYRVPSDPVVLMLGILAGWWLLAAVASPNWKASFREFFTVWTFLVIPVILSAVRERRRLFILVGAASVTMCLVYVYSIVQFFTGVELFHSKGLRSYPFASDLYLSSGMFSHHLTFANSALMVLLLIIGMAAVRLRAGRKKLWLVPVFLGVFALAASGSRGAWLALVFGLVVLGILMGRRVLMWGLGSLVVVALIVGLFFPAVADRAASTASLKYSSNATRLNLWKVAGEMISDRPLTGTGPGAYKDLMEPYVDKFETNIKLGHTHNTFLQTAVETGIPGLIIFLGVWVVFFLKTVVAFIRFYPPPGLLQGILLGGILAVTGFLVAGMTQHNFGDMENRILLLFIIGVVVTACRMLREEKRGFAAD